MIICFSFRHYVCLFGCELYLMLSVGTLGKQIVNVINVINVIVAVHIDE